MGSGSSKSENLNNGYKSSPNKNQSKAKSENNGKSSSYQTSIYGWGKLKHPFKPSPSSNSCKTHNKNHHQNEESLAFANKNEKRHSDALVGVNEFSADLTPTSRVAVTTNEHETEGKHSNQISMNNDNPSSTTPTGIRSNQNDEQQNLDNKYKTVNGNNVVVADDDDISSSTTNSPKTTPAKKHVLSNPSFYGHFRCPNCGKYWRSGHSKEGCFQDCSKCGTPTSPRR